jgi:two-component system sensor histidine kinase KdpD
MESERLRNTLLAAMSHDVRTPLTALIGQAETLEQTGALTVEQHSMVRSMAHEARELSALVGNLLDMARLESGQVQLRKDWQSVEEVVGSSIRSARHALGTLEVQTDLPLELPLVEFDVALMERVLVNLLENACKYGVTQPVHVPAICISARATATSLELKVRDFGPGLPVSSRGQEQTLFDKFTRGKAESSTRGVGLGLAICKAIVEAHRGTINAALADGGGAEFSICLPRTTPPAPALTDDV